MLMVCLKCGESGKPEEEGTHSFEKYEDWLNHLITDRHRAAVEGTIRKWKKWEDERSFVVEHTESLRPRQVVEYFSKLGIVLDFYYSKNMRFCVVRMDGFDGKRILLNGNKDTRIGDNKIKITEKITITPTFWTFLLNPEPVVREDSSPAQSLVQVEELRIEAKNETRRVTVVPTNSWITKRVNNSKLKGIFGEETSVPGPISAPVAIITNNTNVANQVTKSPSSESYTSSQYQAQSSSSKPKRSRPKRSKKKNEERKAEVSANSSTVQVQSSRTELQDNGAVSDSGSELSVQTIRKPELDFRGGFQVGTPYRNPVINNPVPANTGTGPATIHPNNVHVPPVQQPQIPSTNVYVHPRFQRFQQVTQPQMSHPVLVPVVTVAHVQAIQSSSQRQRYPFPGAPPMINNMPNIRPVHIPDSYAQQRYNQQYPSPVVVIPTLSTNQSRPAHPQNVPVAKPEPAKFQKLFFDLIKKDFVHRNHSKETYASLSLQEQLTEFMRAMTLDDCGIINRRRLVEDMQHVLRQESELRHCKIYPFGSFITGLGDIQSDVDIYVDAYGTTEGFNLPSKPLSNIDLLNFCRRVLKKARCPRTNQYFCSQLIPIREARVPILKLKHVPTQIHCDLSFENLISVRNSEMITLFMALHPVVKPLMTLLRYWGKFHSLTGSNSIKNYALNLLVLVYLANQKIIPSISDLQNMYWKHCKKQNNKAYIIDGWDTSFYADVPNICKEFVSTISSEKVQSNLPKLIITLAIGFFEMFGKADFSMNMVCTLTAEFLPKSLFNAGYETDLPEFLERYKDWSARQTSDRRLNVKTPLCIQDPFVLSFNVGSVCPQATLLKFQVACIQTMNILGNKENYSSLLDAFSRLPPEVGDKKFINLQERHKVTLKLIQEVKAQFGEIPESIEQEENGIAVHLRPIKEIVSKKTILLGKGWQSYQTFQPNNEFQEIFSRWIKMCQLNKQQQPESLFQKLKKLWGIFVDEFFDTVWTKSFDFAQNKECVALRKRQYSGSPKFRQTFENLFADKKEKKGKEAKLPIVISPESAAPLVAQLSDLDSIEERLVYMRFKCSTAVATWEKRNRLFKQLCEGLDGSETPPTDLPTSGNEKPKKKKKEIRESKKRSKSARIKLNKSPLEIEEEITKLILDSSKPSNTPLLVFYCLIKMDLGIMDELPTVYVVYEKDSSTDDQMYLEGVSTLSAIIEDLLPEYACYRLRQWFEKAGLYESILKASSSDLKQLKTKSKPSKSKSDKAKSAESVTETAPVAEVETADNDQDLLLPPSSDESDDNDDPNDNNND